MAFFDFHFHPLTKRFLTEFDDRKREQDPNYTEPIHFPRLGNFVDKLIGEVLQTQCCISQVETGQVQLGIAAIAPVEYAFASRKGLLNLLEWRTISPLDTDFFDFIYNSKGSYHTLFQKELGFYRWAAGDISGSGLAPARQRIKLISRKPGPVANQIQPGMLNVAMAIEGGHALSRHTISDPTTTFDPVEVVTALRQHAAVDFFYLTLTHLSDIPEQSLCSHAFGFKLVSERKVPVALPRIGGLLPLGKRVVRACVDTQTVQFPILIDIKHMSVMGRSDYFRYRHHLLTFRPEGFQPPKMRGGQPWWPIIATHMGVAGYSSFELEFHLATQPKKVEQSVHVELKPQQAGRMPEPAIQRMLYFNPSSISLFDDDIMEIVRSDGLIGVSLDARVLGYTGRLSDGSSTDDFFSVEDFINLFPRHAQEMRLEAPNPFNELSVTESSRGPVTEEALRLDEVDILVSQVKRQSYLFCLNVLHIIAVIKAMGNLPANRQAWDFVCLGSDYDGLIDSLREATTAAALPDFRQRLLTFYMEKAEEAYRAVHPDAPELLPRSDTS